MNDKEKIEQLKSLKIDRLKEGFLFESQQDCLNWADKVAPLLKFNNQLYNSFMEGYQYIVIEGLSASLYMSHLNKMIGALSQAIIELEQMPKEFPLKPDSVKQNFLHEFEDGDFDTDEQINDLISLMFEYPEREFFLFHNTNAPFSQKLRSAEKQNIILLNEVERFYYKHPKHKKDYIRVPENNPKSDWEKALIESGPEFQRHTIKLTQKATRDSAISYKNYQEKQKIKHPFELKPNFYGLGIDLEKVYLWVRKKINKNT